MFLRKSTIFSLMCKIFATHIAFLPQNSGFRHKSRACIIVESIFAAFKA